MSWALASLRHPGSSRRMLVAALASTFNGSNRARCIPYTDGSRKRQRARRCLFSVNIPDALFAPVAHGSGQVSLYATRSEHIIRGAAVAPPRSRQCIVHAVGGHGSLTSMPSASAAPAAVPDNHELLLGHQLGEYAVHWACRHTLFDSFRGIRARRCCASRNKHP